MKDASFDIINIDIDDIIVIFIVFSFYFVLVTLFRVWLVPTVRNFAHKNEGSDNLYSESGAVK